MYTLSIHIAPIPPPTPQTNCHPFSAFIYANEEYFIRKEQHKMHIQTASCLEQEQQQHQQQWKQQHLMKEHTVKLNLLSRYSFRYTGIWLYSFLNNIKLLYLHLHYYVSVNYATETLVRCNMWMCVCVSFLMLTEGKLKF